MNPAVYQARRHRLLAAMRQQTQGQPALAIIFTAAIVMRNRDADYPYRHDSYFYYLTGFTEPQACLVLVSHASKSKSILFCREKNLEREIWDGYRYGPAQAKIDFAMEDAYAIDELDKQLPLLLENQSAIFYPLGSDLALDTRVQQWLTEVRQQTRGGVVAPTAFYDVRAILDEMRLFKDASEIQLMQQAADISAQAHVRVLRMCRPGLFEHAIEAELLHEFRRQGAAGPAYGSIVAAGSQACVLHYRSNDAILKDGDLLLVDAACEYGSYAADITRTFPINGRFSSAQRELYELVLAAQMAAIAVARPGQRFNDPHEAALRVLVQGMLDVGLLQGTLEELLANGSYRQFYMHRTSHWLGMDVHDCGEYRELTANPAGERPWRMLQAGMVLTIEPGIYIRPAENVPEKYWHIGIRIEDDVLITAHGCEVLTHAAPKTVAEIEALMAQARVSAESI